MSATVSTAKTDANARVSAVPAITLPLPRWLAALLFDRTYSGILSAAILLAELVLGVLIIQRVPYTEIDWIAYMQEVEGFLGGERDYLNLRGDTGPLVYPAGFVYLYSALHYITESGANIRLAQYLFFALYLVTLAVVHRLYRASTMLPPCVMVLLSLSKRIHSIFMLRLFNDCLSMLLLYLAVLFIVRSQWRLSSLCFTLALSIKMNILLFAPGYLLLLMYYHRVHIVIAHLLGMLFVQVLLALPFLTVAPMSYISKAFEFSRVFFYKWTVNLKVLPEAVFLHPYTSTVLLACHLALLLYFLNRFSARVGGITSVMKHGVIGVVTNAPPMIQQPPSQAQSSKPVTAQRMNPDFVLSVLFVTNFVGIAFARSLHYQFYVWYFHTLPYLLAFTNNQPWPSSPGVPVRDLLPALVKLGMLAAVEVCWNVYPAQWWSSGLLITAHLWLLVGLIRARLPEPTENPSIKVKLK